MIFISIWDPTSAGMLSFTTGLQIRFGHEWCLGIHILGFGVMIEKIYGVKPEKFNGQLRP